MSISRGEPVLDSTSWTQTTCIYIILVANVCQSRLSMGIQNESRDQSIEMYIERVKHM
jgi:hypothetical protein